MYVKHRMTALMALDPDAARKQLLSAFVKANCHYRNAAAIVGCGVHSFARWASQLGIRDRLRALEEQAEREGWHHGKKGGAGYHKDPAERARKASETRKAKTRGAEP